jgi:hypothetical protein
MRRLTLKEVNEQYSGILPPDATLRPDDEAARPAPAAKPNPARRKSAERFAILNRFVDFSLAGLSRADIAVWLVLYRDTRDGIARTAYDNLARRAGCNRRNVGRAVRRLVRLGLVKIVYRGGLRRGVSVYRVLPLPKRE